MRNLACNRLSLIFAESERHSAATSHLTVGMGRLCALSETHFLTLHFLSCNLD